MESPVTPGQRHSPSQALPSISSLTNGLPPTSQPSPHSQMAQVQPSRDSGTWPHPPSKHSSMNNANLQLATLLNPDDAQPRSSVPSTPTSARLSQLSQTGPTLPSINQGFELNGVTTNGAHRGSVDYYTQDSRRSSIDSRMHNNFNNLAINNPTSPYESQNPSQVSLAASLRRPNGQLSPLSSRASLRQQHAPRIAPPIVPNVRGPGAPDPTAAKPTQGFAWAFPDSTIEEEEKRRGSSSGDSSNSHTMSRQNSYTASSIRSSIFSNESALPTGQRRFDDDSATTHHHSMQHRAVSSLQQEHAQGAAGGNYSRTPELRVSHKLAERKRRSEMKDLFEDLHKAVPSNGGAKASKWEILTKAIDYIRSTQIQERSLHGEISRLRNDAEYARDSQKENESLRTEICVMHERLRRLDPGTSHIYGQYTSQLAQHQTQVNGQHSQVSLPPMHASAQQQQQYSGVQAPGQMQGVEYGGRRPSYEMR